MSSYRGQELVDIPSGMGGTLPAAVAKRNVETVDVICLHDEFYPNWVMTVDADKLKPMSYRLTGQMKRVIDSRL